MRVRFSLASQVKPIIFFGATEHVTGFEFLVTKEKM